jgi:hypothetical protein
LFTIITSLILVSFSQSVNVEGKVNLPILEKVNFTNDLDWEISSFYISSADSDYFGGEILSARGKEVLPPGGSVTLFMVPGEYDILLFDVDYDIWSGKCFISGSDNGDTGEGPIYISFNEVDLFYEEFGYIDETYDVEIEVYTPVPVDYIFFSPSDSNSWGVDYLGEISLVNGDEYSFSFMKTEPPTTFDLQIIFNDGSQLLLEVDGSGDAAFSLGVPPDDGTSDDDMPDNIDDDDLPIDQQPGGDGENKDDDQQGDEEERSLSSLGMIFVILSLVTLGLLWKRKRMN